MNNATTEWILQSRDLSQRSFLLFVETGWKAVMCLLRYWDTVWVWGLIPVSWVQWSLWHLWLSVPFCSLFCMGFCEHADFCGHTLMVGISLIADCNF